MLCPHRYYIDTEDCRNLDILNFLEGRIEDLFRKDDIRATFDVGFKHAEIGHLVTTLGENKEGDCKYETHDSKCNKPYPRLKGKNVYLNSEVRRSLKLRQHA